MITLPPYAQLFAPALAPCQKAIAAAFLLIARPFLNLGEKCGLAEFEHDVRFANDTSRAEHRGELIRLLDQAFARYPRTHWEQLFREKGFWFSVVNRISDLPADPQVAANDYLVELDNGLKLVSSPFMLEKTPAPVKKGAPSFSQHTDEILQDVCGYTAEEVLALKATEVAW